MKPWAYLSFKTPLLISYDFGVRESSPLIKYFFHGYLAFSNVSDFVPVIK